MPQHRYKATNTFQLYLARDKSWCLLQEQLIKEKKNKPAILAYTEESFQNLLTVIRTSQEYADGKDNPYRLSEYYLIMNGIKVKIKNSGCMLVWL